MAAGNSWPLQQLRSHNSPEGTEIFLTRFCYFPFLAQSEPIELALPQAARLSIFFNMKISGVAGLRGTWIKDALLIGLRREEKSPALAGFKPTTSGVFFRRHALYHSVTTTVLHCSRCSFFDNPRNLRDNWCSENEGLIVTQSLKRLGTRLTWMPSM